MENNWETLDVNSFWARTKESDHVIHLYKDDKSLLESLTGFASASLLEDVAVVVIASKSHLDMLEANLRREGFDVFSHTVSGRYLPLNARELLSQFMFDGAPDKGLFSYMLASFSLRSRRLRKSIRVFAELAGLLHADGNHHAVTTLEQLWAQHRAVAPFCFFRACKASDFPEQPEPEELKSQYSFIIGDKTSRSTVCFQRLG